MVIRYFLSQNCSSCSIHSDTTLDLKDCSKSRKVLTCPKRRKISFFSLHWTNPFLIIFILAVELRLPLSGALRVSLGRILSKPAACQLMARRSAPHRTFIYGIRDMRAQLITSSQLVCRCVANKFCQFKFLLFQVSTVS